MRGFFTVRAAGAPHPASTRVSLLLNKVDGSWAPGTKRADANTPARLLLGFLWSWF